jgi:hypothetical protein
MALIAKPGADNGWHAGHVRLLLDNHRHWTGRALIPEGRGEVDTAETLYHAPFVVLAHDSAADPCFTYANLTAQRLFEMAWNEIVGLPSRYSAEAPARAERERLLERVARFGFIDDYQGVRVARSGKRFLIHQATVWNLIDAAGAKVGQAAAFADWRPLIP